MKHIAKSLVVAGAMVVAGNATADWFDDVKPYIGAEYVQAWSGKKHNLPKTFPGGSAFFGIKFTECFAVELGGDWFSRKNRTFTGQGSVNGATPVFPLGHSMKSHVHRNGWHADLVGFLPIYDDCLELLGTIGYGYVQGKVSYTDATNSFYNQSAKTKGNSVLRLGIGLDGMVTEYIGLRAKVGWQNTGSLHLKNWPTPPAGYQSPSKKPFKDTITLSVGAFVKW